MGTDSFKIRWAQRAEEDLEAIIASIAEDAPIRAVTFGKRLFEAAGSLRHSPYRYPRTKEHPAYRHLIVKRYRIIYRVDDKKRMVWIMRILFPYQLFKNHGEAIV